MTTEDAETTNTAAVAEQGATVAPENASAKKASSKKSSSPRRPFASFSAMAVALSASVLYRVVEIVGFEVSPVTDSSSM